MRLFIGAFLMTLSLAATAFQPRTGHWWNPAESGRGFNIDVQNGTMVLTFYTYDANGNAQWYLAAGPMNDAQHSFTATLDKYAGGQCVACSYRPATVVGNDGIVTVVFATETAATVTLPGGHVSTIQPLNFSYGDPPQGLLGEWIYVYDIISTFADRFDYTTIRGATPTGNGTVWDDSRNAACELQVNGVLAGQVACFDFTSSGAIANSYLYAYGVDETFSGEWVSLATSSEFAMKGFRIKGASGFSKAVTEKSASVKLDQARYAVGRLTKHAATMQALGAAILATRH